MSCCSNCSHGLPCGGGAQLGQVDATDPTAADCRARGMVLDLSKTPPGCVPVWELPGNVIPGGGLPSPPARVGLAAACG